MLDKNQSVASVVLEHSECAEVFQSHRIDFCCRGELSLDAAARERGVALDGLLAELDRAIAARRGEVTADARALTTPQLIAHIVAKHHVPLRRTLPFVRALANKVARVHGAHNPKLVELDAAVGVLCDTLVPHLDEEERRLFPLLESAEPSPAETAKQLDAMHAEHLQVAGQLERIRAAADDFALPDWACNSYRTLFAELSGLESDIFHHVHLENHVLRPRFASV